MEIQQLQFQPAIKSDQEMMHSEQKYSEVDCCQICLNNSDEDLYIIADLVIRVQLVELQSQGILTSRQSFNALLNTQSFESCLRTLFEPKYQEINSSCCHQVVKNKLHEFFHFNDEITDIKQLDEQSIQKCYGDIQKVQMEFINLLNFFDKTSRSVFQLTTEFDSEFQQRKEKSLNFNKNQNKNDCQLKAIHILQKWFLEKIENPYPSTLQKEMLSAETGMSVKQIQNWFTNCRKRYLDPLKRDIKQNKSVEKSDFLFRKSTREIQPDEIDNELKIAEDNQQSQEKPLQASKQFEDQLISLALNVKKEDEIVAFDFDEQKNKNSKELQKIRQQQYQQNKVETIELSEFKVDSLILQSKLWQSFQQQQLAFQLQQQQLLFNQSINQFPLFPFPLFNLPIFYQGFNNNSINMQNTTSRIDIQPHIN